MEAALWKQIKPKGIEKRDQDKTMCSNTLFKVKNRNDNDFKAIHMLWPSHESLMDPIMVFLCSRSVSQFFSMISLIVVAMKCLKVGVSGYLGQSSLVVSGNAPPCHCKLFILSYNKCKTHLDYLVFIIPDKIVEICAFKV